MKKKCRKTCKTRFYFVSLHQENAKLPTQPSTSETNAVESAPTINDIKINMEEQNVTMSGALSASLEATLAIEMFLNENYRFRRNTLNGKVEYATLPKADVFRPDDRGDTQELSLAQQHHRQQGEAG